MTNTAKLQLVAKPAIPLPFDDTKGKKRIEAIRAQLLAASIKYVNEGKDGTRGDRIRTASNLSGITVNLIEVESRK